jgi:hypothetical protein
VSGDLVINVTGNVVINSCCKSKPLVLRWVFGPIQEQAIQGPVFEAQMITLTETQFVEGRVEPVTAKGNPAEVQDPSFTSSSPLVAEAVSTDGLNVRIVAKAPGSTQIRWRADADLGDGIKEIEAIEDFVVRAGEAVGARFVFGTPQEQS